MESTANFAKAVVEKTPSTIATMMNGVSNVAWGDLAKVTGDFIEKHPKEMSIAATCSLIFAFPCLVATPGLAELGFTSLGPTAGSAAAAYQSAYGATTGFSLFQSAAMGGYGTAAVGVMVKASSLAVATTAQLVKKLV